MIIIIFNIIVIITVIVIIFQFGEKMRQAWFWDLKYPENRVSHHVHTKELRNKGSSLHRKLLQ